MNAKKPSTVKNLHEKLGAFVIVFEDVNWSMVCSIREILVKHGMDDIGIQEILLAGLTAEPLRDMLYSLCGETLKPDKHEKKILSYIFSEIQKLISTRNLLIHSAWAELEIDEVVVGHTIKLKRNQNGSVPHADKITPDILEGHFEKARHCMWLLNGISRCIVFDQKIKDIFEKTKSGYTARSINVTGKSL